MIKFKHQLSACKKQKGITLLEVLVGFVIFTSSIVAVLDYVSGQIYLVHLADSNHKKTQLIYDFNVTKGLAGEDRLDNMNGLDDFDFSVSSTVMDSVQRKNKTFILNRNTHFVKVRDSVFEWTVLKSEWSE